MHQPKAGGRLSPYSATSSKGKKSNAKSTSGHKVIVGTSWRVVVTIFVLSCMHMQAVVQVMQAVAKNALLQQQQITISLLGGM